MAASQVASHSDGDSSSSEVDEGDAISANGTTQNN
jgi:hypothetical protein